MPLATAAAYDCRTMTLRVRSPLAEINTPPEGKRIRRLETVTGTRVGLLWSQHASSEKFWPVFERVVEATLQEQPHRRPGDRLPGLFPLPLAPAGLIRHAVILLIVAVECNIGVDSKNSGAYYLARGRQA